MKSPSRYAGARRRRRKKVRYGRLAAAVLILLLALAAVIFLLAKLAGALFGAPQGGGSLPAAASSQQGDSSQVQQVTASVSLESREGSNQSREGLWPLSTYLRVGEDPVSEETADPNQMVEPKEFNPVWVTGAGSMIPAIQEFKATTNADTIGWLRIPQTNINYPVVVGPDTNYYTSLNYYKQVDPTQLGVIWAQTGTKFGTSANISKNTVLFGHNWTNYSATPRIGYLTDQRFAQLTGYHYTSYAKNRPYILYSTESEDMVFKVFAAFYTEVDFDYLASDPDQAGMQYIINEALARSRHNFGVDVNSSDKIITLSTCTRAYGQTNQQRFVVMARLLRAGEEVTATNPVYNPNHKQPSL